MRDDLLKAFVVAADAGSFSKAARQLYTTHQTLVRQMDELERELGFKLFDRGHQGVTLTAAGKEYLDGARRLLQMSEGIEARARQAANGVRTVRIGSGTWIPRLTEAFTRASEATGHLEVRQLPIQHFDERALDELQEGDFELLLWVDDTNIAAHGLELFELGRACPVACISPNSPLASKESLTLSDLAGCPIEASGLYWFSQLGRRDPGGASLNGAQDLPCDLRAVYDACMSQGMVCLMWPIGSMDMPNLVTIPFDSTYERAFGFAHEPDIPQEVLTFAQAVREDLAGQ